MAKIISVGPGFEELERKFTFTDLRVMVEVYRHVLACRDEFVTQDAPSMLPDVPAALLPSVSAPLEITPMRRRFYSTDKKLEMPAQGIELRQEPKPNGTVRQVIKIGSSDVEEDNPTLDRTEYPARLYDLGPVLHAVRDKAVRRRLVKAFGRKKLRQPIRMMSQRFRFPYHPEGDRHLTMEIAFDPILVGQCFDGFSWAHPMMELEIKNGPQDKVEAGALLDREERRLTARFEMVRHLHSNPSPGFDHLREMVGSKQGRLELNALPQGFYDWRAVPLNGRVSQAQLETM